MRTAALASATFFLAVALEGCRAPDRPDRGPFCQGFVFIDWRNLDDPEQLPQSEFGELRCNGACPDGSRCTVQHEEFDEPQGGVIRREWCACPGQSEPAFCHGVRELFVSGENRIWRFNCRPLDGCPAEGDFCREIHRQVDAPEGVDKRFLAQCECVAKE